MVRAPTPKLRVNPVLGTPPTLEWRPIGELMIDEAYQRSTEAGPSQALINRIAVRWDWGLCQPLAVSRRPDGALTIVDGQHRAAAAKRRGDIPHLPCVITSYASFAEEAAAFVSLNQQRRPLSALDLFKASLASGDAEAVKIKQALDQAGLRLARHTNNQDMKEGQVGNVGGLQRCHRTYGEPVLTTALRTLSRAYQQQVLRYAGSIFPGIVAVVAGEIHNRAAPNELIDRLAPFVGREPQSEWVRRFAQAKAADLNLKHHSAAEQVMRAAWVEFSRSSLGVAPPRPHPVAPPKVEKPVETFEEKLGRVERGEARIADKVEIRRPDPSGTLGGIGTAMF